MAGTIRIGVSGWRYTPWRGNFYPPRLAQRRELQYAARQFNSIEINGSFYSLQRPDFYAQWAAETPPGFVFAVKGGRYLTHMLKLRGIESALANFLASGLFELGDKLGPILWQFPPMLGFNPQVFDDFLSVLPRTTEEAMWIAHAYDHRLKERHSLVPQVNMPLRHAVEVRHESFAVPAFIALLRNHRVAWVVADTPRPWPLFEDVTADFIYMRLHGSTELYNSRYSSEELDRWAALMAAWAAGDDPDEARRISPERARKTQGRDVYCYFDNTDKLHAPDNARELMAKLGVAWHPPEAAAPSAGTTGAGSKPAAGSPRSR